METNENPQASRTRTRTRTGRLLPLAAVAVLSAAVLAGCGNGLSGSGGDGDAVSEPSGSATTSTGTPSTPSTTPAAPATSTDPGASGTSGPAPTATPGYDASAPAEEGSSASSSTCAVDELRVGVEADEGGGAAGSSYLLVTFENTGDRTCVVDGHPGVSFVGGSDGTQVGEAADRTGQVAPVRLAPGDVGTALLQVANAGNFDASACAPTTADGFRVYPPDSRASVFVPYDVQACQGDIGQSQVTVSQVTPRS